MQTLSLSLSVFLSVSDMGVGVVDFCFLCRSLLPPCIPRQVRRLYNPNTTSPHCSGRTFEKVSSVAVVRNPTRENQCHRTSVAASLVQGVYILERDRQEKRQGPQALAPPWWDFFHFQLVRILVDDADLSIFGAVYEFKFPPSYDNYQLVQNPPRYIIAFRGTVIKPDTRSQDIKLGLQFVRNRLQQSSRFNLAMEAVQSMAFLSGATNIWLAGHSLGAAIALLVGKNMVKMGGYIETYLFNPPFPTDPIEQIRNHKLKRGVRFASAITAGVAVALTGHHQRAQIDDSFSRWVPYLFLNPSDPLCAGYIRYFEQRVKMVEIGHGAIARFAKQNSSLSGRNLFSGARGIDFGASHLLPSAYLTINLSSTKGFNQAHGLHQWWKSKHCQFKLHQFRMLLSMNLRQRLLLDLAYDERIMGRASKLPKPCMNQNKDQFKSKELDMIYSSKLEAVAKKYPRNKFLLAGRNNPSCNEKQSYKKRTLWKT